MGNPDDIMAKLSGNKSYTKIDLSKGYWQIQMEEHSKELTAFGTPDGCCQFKRMPFGLVNSAATFNRMMRKMPHQAKNIEHYVNHVLVHTAVWMENLVNLRELFTRIRKVGLIICPSKCCLAMLFISGVCPVHVHVEE